MSGFGRKKVVRKTPENRRPKRSKVRAIARVQTPVSTEPATVVEVWESGARLLGTPPSSSRRDAQLHVNGLTIFGSIAWRKDDSFGFKFAHHLNDHGSKEIHKAIQEVDVASPVFDREAVLQDLVNKTPDKEVSEKLTDKG